MNRGSLFKISVLVVTVALGLTAGEMALRRLAPIEDPYREFKLKQPIVNQYIRSEFPPNFKVHTEIAAGIPGMTGRHVFSTNNLGFRGDYLAVPKPPGEFRVFAIGGSTTECAYLDDTETMPAALQSELQAVAPAGRTVKVYNAGKSGDRSYDHVSMLVHRILHLQPDAIVVFLGINDLSASIAETDYLHRVEVVQSSVNLRQMLGMIATEWQIPRRLRAVALRLQPKSERKVLEEIRWRLDLTDYVAAAHSGQEREGRPRVWTEGFRTNLLTLIGAAGANGVKVTLMTQPSSWNSRVDPTAASRHWMLNHYREEVMDAGLEAFNNVTRALAQEHGLPVADIARTMPKSGSHIYDDVHLTPVGAAFAARALAQTMASQVR